MLKLVAFVPAEAAERALGALRSHDLGHEAVRLGTAVGDAEGLVLVRTAVWAPRGCSNSPTASCCRAFVDELDC